METEEKYITKEEMTLNEYQWLAQRTRNKNLTQEQKQTNGLFGIAGEAGEVMDLYKKHYFQGHNLDSQQVVEELGDLMWYIAELSSGLGVTMEEIAKHNIDKLQRRYPEGFMIEKSINREKNKPGMQDIPARDKS